MLPEGAWAGGTICMERAMVLAEADILRAIKKGSASDSGLELKGALDAAIPGGRLERADGVLRHAPVSCRHRAASVLQVGRADSSSLAG